MADSSYGYTIVLSGTGYEVEPDNMPSADVKNRFQQTGKELRGVNNDDFHNYDSLYRKIERRAILPFIHSTLTSAGRSFQER